MISANTAATTHLPRRHGRFSSAGDSAWAAPTGSPPSFGSSTADLFAGPAGSQSWTISAPNAGTVGGIVFSGFENVRGGDDADDFTLAATLAGTLDGGGGPDTLRAASGSGDDTAIIAAGSLTVGDVSAQYSSIEQLIVFRLCQGFGGAAGMVVSRAIVRDLHSGVEEARLLSLLMLVFSVSPICAPLIGNAVLAFISWRRANRLRRGGQLRTTRKTVTATATTANHSGTQRRSASIGTTTGQLTPAIFICSVHLDNCAARGSYQQNLFANLCITIRQKPQAVDPIAIFTVTPKLGSARAERASFAHRAARLPSKMAQLATA